MDQTTMLITAIVTLATVITTLAGVMWKAALWLRDHVVNPVVKNHLELIDALKRDLPLQTDATQRMASAHKEHMTEIKSQGVKLDRLNVQAENHGMKLEQIAKGTDAQVEMLDQLVTGNSATHELLLMHDDAAKKVIAKIDKMAEGKT